MKLHPNKIRNCLLYLLVFGFTALPFGNSTPTAAQSASPLVVRYNGPGNSGDGARKVAVDRSGNFYVTGYSNGSSTSADYATSKYDPNGNQVWVKRYNGSGNSDDAAFGLVVDGLGNVYVTGYSNGFGTSADYATIKYDKSGNQLWVKRYNGSGNSLDDANDLVVDGLGNVYVTGISFGSGTSYDSVTIKYAPNGNQLWVKRYNGSGNSDDSASDIAVDRFGNVYVTGDSVGFGAGDDYATIKYDTNGNLLWVKRYNGSGNYNDEARDIAVDGLGNVYVTGESFGSFGTESKYATIKYDRNGNQRWVKLYNGSVNSFDGAFDLALDNLGNVYVTGISRGSTTDDDYATIKYDANGTQLWVRRYNGSGNDVDQATDLALDGLGNIYVTGDSFGSGTDFDQTTIRYDTNGN